MVSAAHDLRDRGVIAIVMHPGWVQTEMGGENATTSTADSAKGIRSVIEGLTLAAYAVGAKDGAQGLLLALEAERMAPGPESRQAMILRRELRPRRPRPWGAGLTLHDAAFAAGAFRELAKSVRLEGIHAQHVVERRQRLEQRIALPRLDQALGKGPVDEFGALVPHQQRDAVEIVLVAFADRRVQPPARVLRVAREAVGVEYPPQRILGILVAVTACGNRIAQRRVLDDGPGHGATEAIVGPREARVTRREHQPAQRTPQRAHGEIVDGLAQRLLQFEEIVPQGPLDERTLLVGVARVVPELDHRRGVVQLYETVRHAPGQALTGLEPSAHGQQRGVGQQRKGG